MFCCTFAAVFLSPALRLARGSVVLGMTSCACSALSGKLPNAMKNITTPRVRLTPRGLRPVFACFIWHRSFM
jgi:hypothetical protein